MNFRGGIAILWFAWTGCGASRPPACQLPETTPLVVEASDRLNPDEHGRSLPTIIRIYQLSDIGALEQASFQEIWRDPTGTLGESLLAQDELTIYPEQTVRRPLDRNPDANFLVGMGIFRRPVGTTWRSVMALPPPRSETQCASQQTEGEPVPPAVPHVRLFVEDNRVEGTLELVRPSSGGACALGDMSCSAAEDAQPEQPEAPQAPEGPQAPSAPSGPKDVRTLR